MSDSELPRSLESAPEALQRIVDAIRDVVSPTAPAPTTPADDETPAPSRGSTTRSEV